MAPLWGSSWASAWALADHSYLQPSVGQILMSKRVRYAAISLAAFSLFFLGLLNNGFTPSSSVGPTPHESHVVDWSRFAYTQYVTNAAYLCNSAMIFESLFRLGSKADRVMMYPESMMDPADTNPSSDEARLLVKARDVYKAKLVPISVQHQASSDSKSAHHVTWADSFTKLLAFNQTRYQRVLSLDSDATILQTMDELFLLPPCPVAMPRAYWVLPDNKILSSQLILIQPSAVEFDRILNKMESANPNDYDMEIVNQLYADTAMVLPHRPYDLLTGEFRGHDHQNYLGTDEEEWDPVAIFNEAKFLHFSDWPVPKPWIPMPDSTRQEKQPECTEKNGQEDCSARVLWNGFYEDFAQRRLSVCGNARNRDR